MPMSILHKLVSRLCVAGLVAVASVASAQAAQPKNVSNDHTLAMLNSAHILNYLTAMSPEMGMRGVDAVESGFLVRPAPGFPVWILEAPSETILYYEGKKSFRGKSATLLVDEAGVRFGVKALEKAKSSKAVWQSVLLGGKTHQMYCAPKHPFSVCTLIPTPLEN